MSPTEQKILGAFLASRGRRDVQEYLKLSASSSPEQQAAAVEKRRLWAQAQQTNPKFQEEALWVLAHTHLLLEALEKSSEELIWLKATPSKAPSKDGVQNYYDLLGVPPDATTAQIQDAHRLRYRDARQMKDRHEAHQVYAELDEAWRVLSEPSLRDDYDAQQKPALRLSEHPTQSTSGLDSTPKDREALTHSPDLTFTGPSQLRFDLKGKPEKHHLNVERIGPGLVDATLRSDQEWLKVSPERLDPHASSQRLTLTLLPERVPGKGALGQVVLKNFNGQRLSLHVRVRTAPETHIRRGFLAALLGVASLVGAGLLLAPQFLASSPEPPDSFSQ